MPKKTEKKAVAATASAHKKQAAKLDIELVSAPELKPKARKTPAKKAPPAPGAPANVPKVPLHSAVEPAAVEPATQNAKKKRAPISARATNTAKVTIKDETGASVEVSVPVSAPVLDPIGSVIDGEAHTAADADVPFTPGESEALATALAEEIKSNEEPEYLPEAPHVAGSAPPAKQERLQKILSHAGIASRRRAEEMIVEGRVMVNGQVVTQLGAKADLGRDHIRVDGKLIAGAERHRYFVLNKPRGYVTTVSDPEGRPTVMQFFEKMHQRLYPVGRLDYLSEGLLLVTNDGELANQLTRASLGVEKTYLVKVAGNPSEEELDRLRSGVSIERGRPGSERVGTAPATIRQVRQGDNPWYEVVLIEGRNRELRKMFEQIGHFVEKIRRVGYGPLVLDLEPGKFRELSAEEVKALKLTAEGKLKPRRPRASQMLPRDAGYPSDERGAKRRERKPFAPPSGRPGSAPQRSLKPSSGSSSRPAYKPRFNSAKPERSSGRSQFPQLESKDRGEARRFGPPRGQSKPFRSREDFESGLRKRFENRGFGSHSLQRNYKSEGDDSQRRGFGKRGDRPQFKRNDRRSPDRGPRPPFNRSERPSFRHDDQPPFSQRRKAAEDFRGRPPESSSRPARKQFDAPPAGKSGSRPSGKRFASGPPAAKRFGSPPASGQRSFSKGPGKPSFRSGGKSGSRPGSRKRD